MKKDRTTQILFLMIPFVVIVPGLLWKSQQIFFMLSALVIAAVAIKNRWVTAFLVYATAWQLFLYLSNFKNPAMVVRVQDGSVIILFLLCGSVIYKAVTESGGLDGFYHAIRAAVLLQIGVSIMAFLWFDPWVAAIRMFVPTVGSPDPIGPFIGTMGNRDILGFFIALSLPVFVDWITIDVSGIKVNPLLIFIVLFMLMCPSPGTVGGIIALGVYYRKSWKGMVGAIALSIIYAGYHVINSAHLHDILNAPKHYQDVFVGGQAATDAKDGGRLWKWMHAMAKILESPKSIIVGAGPGTPWGKRYPMHNEYLQVWFEMGLVGLSIVLGYLVTTWRQVWGNRKHMMALTVITIGMAGDYPLHIPTTAFLIIIMCGLIEKERANG